jgi:hypothetical protein
VTHVTPRSGAHHKPLVLKKMNITLKQGMNSSHDYGVSFYNKEGKGDVSSSTPNKQKLVNPKHIVNGFFENELVSKEKIQLKTAAHFHSN